MAASRGLQRGYVQLYTGDGKGKTTAALGLALRAVGAGLRVYIGQFMKGQHYAELDALARLPEVRVEQYGAAHFIRREEVGPEDRRLAAEGLARARRALASGAYDVVVLDEAAMAVWFGLLDEQEVLGLLAERPPQVEVVLTGRRASQALIDAADLVTEMREIKHYFAQGVDARAGIER